LYRCGLFFSPSQFYYVVYDAARATVMNSIAPVWDGNETWLVFGGIGLLTAFPLAFAIIIPAVYFPILVMLLALVFRGVAFEFRFKHPALRRIWDGAFCGGSLVAPSRKASCSGHSSRASRSTAENRAVPLHAVAGGLVAKHASVSVDRHVVLAADHPDVYRLVLLGVPRQSPRHGRLSLRPRSSIFNRA
jgi:Cytochrome bd terminal oxidase subunit II